MKKKKKHENWSRITALPVERHHSSLVINNKQSPKDPSLVHDKSWISLLFDMLGKQSYFIKQTKKNKTAKPRNTDHKYSLNCNSSVPTSNTWHIQNNISFKAHEQKSLLFIQLEKNQQKVSSLNQKRHTNSSNNKKY
jgi:hypothetical protein